MRANEYEETYLEFIRLRKNNMTVEEVRKIYSKVFDSKDEPVYKSVSKIDFQMFLIDLYTMYMEGRSDGCEWGLEKLRAER